jgi:pentafunctional AROM polypeptide
LISKLQVFSTKSIGLTILGDVFKFANVRAILLRTVLGSVRVKAFVVSADEREGGLRNILNYGHSIGHAIEAIMAPQMLHGECVAIGMVKEAELARSLGVLSPEAMARVTKCLRDYGLPTSLEEERVRKLSRSKQISVELLLKFMTVDKKNVGKAKHVTLLSAIGNTHEKKATSISDENLRKVLSRHARIGPAPWNSMTPATVIPPGSKSISNRALLLAALGSGSCRLTNLLHSDDTHYMLKALQQLQGASFMWEESGQVLVVKGGCGRLKPPKEPLYLGNAGTASRFLTTACALISGGPPDTILTGNERMKQRPVGPLVNALRNAGSEIKYMGSSGSLPLMIMSDHPLSGGVIELIATISSQYVSSILMCAPYAKTPVTLRLVGGKPISELYIDMTISMMKTFGIEVKKSESEPYTYHIPVGVYRNPSSYIIESDASSATYPLAVAAVTGSTCTIPNIGSDSLQGDARFAISVLRPMGCDVVQTATSTTVTGPRRGKLLPIPQIDMETMTDAFLTASVLAAVAQGTKGNNTNITGIANQRVKECDRIAAMVRELSKFGVLARELEDGIQVTGIDPDQLKSPENGVFCYDDHRVAMSFGVLACALPQSVLILDKNCVEKTWPNWWDVLENVFKVPVSGVDHFPKSVLQHPETNEKLSIILIGMRGAGKTTMGLLGAALLGREFVDFDQELERRVGLTIPQVVEQQGWPAFREHELKVLEDFLENKQTGYIGACGGGIVETPAARKALQQHVQRGGIVIHIHRNTNDIFAYLHQDKSRPAYEFYSTVETWNRRKPLFAECSSHQYYAHSISDIPKGQTVLDIPEVKESFSRFLRVVTGHNISAIAPKPRSFFVALTSPNVSFIQNLDAVTVGCDAVELRVDLLEEKDSTAAHPSVEYVSEQFAILRQASPLPILFTIRSQGQGGRFPPSEEAAAKQLMLLALKWGVEYLDVEIGWSDETIAEVVASRGFTKLIGSHHDVHGSLLWDELGWLEKVAMASKFADIIKLVGTATSLDDNLALERFRHSCNAKSTVPLIAINMGRAGQLSRVLNPVLTPISHPLLPAKAAPGQLSLKEINQCLSLIGNTDPLRFYLLGTPISHSRSPALHNTLFGEVGLPHHYSLHDTSDAKSAIAVAQGADFGGASVTIPLKETIIPFLDELTEEATATGAVNTIVPVMKHGQRHLIGDNTDWIGIQSSFSRNPKSTGQVFPGLVIGNGGTAKCAIFTLHRMGISPIYVACRSPEKLKSMSKYGFIFIASEEEAKKIPEGPAYAVSTIPGNASIDPTVAGIISILLSVPSSALERQFLEMAYLPRETPSMKVAERFKWVTIPGATPLTLQGLRQFELWTGLKVPTSLGRRAVDGERNGIKH